MKLTRLTSTSSTQDVARGLPIGNAVVADHQSAGRGRRDRSWEAPPSTALLASFVLPFHPLASLAAGVAAAEACGAEACGGGVRLKWPNDLLLGGRKLGGILVEVAGDRAIVGIGINLRAAPPGAARLEADRDALLARLEGALERWFGAGPEAVLDAWRGRSDTLGSRVRVTLGEDVFEGLAEDVDDDGALVVDGRRVVAGDVSSLRPAPAASEAPRPTGP